MLNGAVKDFTFAARLKGAGVQSTQFFLSPEPNVTYSACLVRKIEEMFETGKAPYPVERTLLVSGILESCLTSRLERTEAAARRRIWTCATGPRSNPSMPGRRLAASDHADDAIRLWGSDRWARSPGALSCSRSVPFRSWSGRRCPTAPDAPSGRPRLRRPRPRGRSPVLSRWRHGPARRRRAVRPGARQGGRPRRDVLQPVRDRAVLSRRGSRPSRCCG